MQSTQTRTLTALGKTVVLNMIAPATQSASGRIILPDGSRVNYAQARQAYVVDVGPDVSRPIVAGDRVLVAPLVDGVDIDVPGSRQDGDRVREHYRVVAERAILALVSDVRPIEAYEADLRRLCARFEEDHGLAVALHFPPGCKK